MLCSLRKSAEVMGMLALVLAGWLLGAQDEPDAGVTALVTKLVENGKQYGAALPSLSCEESVRSQVMDKGKVGRQVTATATMTVKRTGDEDEPFVENYAWKTRDRRPVAAEPVPGLPFFVHGVFANALGFSSLDLLRCARFTLNDVAGLPELWLSIERKADAHLRADCKTKTPGVRETVSVDRQSGHVTRALWTIPDGEALAARTVSYGSVEYGPVQLGANTFWLPLRAETHMAGDVRRMMIEYSGCHRFASTVTITGGTDVIAPQQ